MGLTGCDFHVMCRFQRPSSMINIARFRSFDMGFSFCREGFASDGLLDIQMAYGLVLRLELL